MKKKAHTFKYESQNGIKLIPMASLLVESSVCHGWICDSGDTGKISQLDWNTIWNEIWFWDDFAPWQRQQYPAFPGKGQDQCRITASCATGLAGKMDKWDIMPLLITQTLLINTCFKNIKSFQMKTLDDTNFQSSLAKHSNKKING